MWKSILGLVILVLLILLAGAFSFLAKTERVESGVLVVEGWADNFALEAAILQLQLKPYQLLVTTGGPVSSDGFSLFINGQLLFPLNLKGQQAHIEVALSGTSVVGVYAHCKVFVNDSVAADFFTSPTTKTYSFLINLPQSFIRTVAVRFDNDAVYAGEDRNLLVHRVLVNGHLIFPFSKNLNYQFISLGEQGQPNFYTFAERAQYMLKELGANHINSVSIPAPYVKVDRTYESAVAVQKWLKAHHPEIKSFNVLTEGVHARRTWMMYQKAFGSSFLIGIIAVDYPDIHSNTWWRSWKGINLVMTQLGKYLYTQFYFYPFG